MEERELAEERAVAQDREHDLHVDVARLGQEDLHGAVLDEEHFLAVLADHHNVLARQHDERAQLLDDLDDADRRAVGEERHALDELEVARDAEPQLERLGQVGRDVRRVPRAEAVRVVVSVLVPTRMGITFVIVSSVITIPG